jgi:uncharacterized protein HemX
MEPRVLRLVVLIALAIAVGFAAGYAYHRQRQPTIEERARNAAEQMKGAVERLTK